jgi:hypothetical protein
LRGANFVRDAARQEVEWINFAERSRGLDVVDQRRGCFATRPIDDHHRIEASLFDPRRECVRQCTRGKRDGCIESARTAAAVTLHAGQNAQAAQKCQV